MRRDPIEAVKQTRVSQGQDAGQTHRDSNGIDVFAHPTKPKAQLADILLVIYVKPSGKMSFPVKKKKETRTRMSATDPNFGEFGETVAQTTSEPPSTTFPKRAQ